MNKQGHFVISLDFELRWGGAEKWDVKSYESYFKSTRESIPFVLDLFEKNSIRATWATVGFLFAETKNELQSYSPDKKPTYQNGDLNYYRQFNLVGADEVNDPLHFAPSLIKKILQTPGQELGTHTFSHYYCNEVGQNAEQFEADLQAAQSIAKDKFGIELKSLVFPRNQYNSTYSKVAKANGIKVIRTNPAVWFWQKSYGKLTPIFRAVDTLFPISGTLAFSADQLQTNEVLELPASRFFRPYSDKEKVIQGLKMNRIKSEMTHAAKNGLVYHLWWHPHNFAKNVQKNVEQLNEIILHFNDLKQQYNFQSAAMLDFKQDEN